MSKSDAWPLDELSLGVLVICGMCEVTSSLSQAGLADVLSAPARPQVLSPSSCK